MNSTISIASDQKGVVCWRRVGYAASLGLLGAAVGAAIILINFLSRIPVYVEPEHIRATPHMLAAAAGAVGGMTMAAAVGYVVYGDRFFASTRQALPPWWWVALGFGFGIAHPLAAGGLFLAIADLAYAAYLGIVTPLQIFNASIDLLLLAPWRALTSGTTFVFTGMAVGLVLGACALLVDRANVSGSRPAARAWVAPVALSSAVVAAAAFGPPALLAKIG